jgi:hypothetical protein
VPDVPEDQATELLLEQYKVYVEMADRVSERRVDATRRYSALLTALLAVTPFLLDQSVPASLRSLLFFMIGSMGIILCVIWILNIRSYRQLGSLKFRVIHEMEARLPFACYRREWEILEQTPDKYKRLSKVEQYIPLLMIIPYVVLLIYTTAKMF